MLLAPTIRINKKGIRLALPKLTLLVSILYCLFYSNFINLANYSFLSYSLGGGSVSNPLFELIKYSRLPVLMLAFVAINLNRDIRKSIYRFFILNLDIIFFFVIMWLGLLSSQDQVNGLFYTLWQNLALLTLLALFVVLRHYYNRENTIYIFFQLLFWSNFIVLPLLIINLHTFGNNWVYNMAFSSKTFYPYCLLSMMISIYGAKLFSEKSLFLFFTKRYAHYIEYILILVLIFFCLFSARRGPLFVMLALTPIYMFIAIGRQWWKRFFILLFLGITTLGSIPKINNYMETHQLEFAIFKKIGDLQNSKDGLSGDQSYNEREQIWELYWDIVEDYPFFGVGAYNSTVVNKNKNPNHRLAGYSTHNLYMGLLVEHGYLGLVTFLAIIIRGLIIMLTKTSLSFFIRYSIFLCAPALLINWNEYNLIPGQVFYWSTVSFLLFPRLFLLKK